MRKVAWRNWLGFFIPGHGSGFLVRCLRAVSLVIAILFIVSLVWSFEVRGSLAGVDSVLCSTAGVVYVFLSRSSNLVESETTKFTLERTADDVGWLPSCAVIKSTRRPATLYACIPLWIPFLLLVACGIALLAHQERKRRQQKSRLCSCGYDLTGNVSGICPECGRKVSDDKAEGLKGK